MSDKHTCKGSGDGGCCGCLIFMGAVLILFYLGGCLMHRQHLYRMEEIKAQK